MAGWKQQVRQYGVVSTRSLVKSAGDRAHPGTASSKDEERKRQADICINCTKPECKGTNTCFKKRRKEQECEAGGKSQEH